MEKGKIKIGKYYIKPKTEINILQENEFNIVNIQNGKIYLSKVPLKIEGIKFWVSIYSENALIVKIELFNADEKYQMNYQTMNDVILQELRKENNAFLLSNLGKPSVERITGLEYDYSWGKILSYFDNKSAEAGIIINYI